MATKSKLVKNGVPVKKFWTEKVKKGDTYYQTTYPVYFTGQGTTGWSLKDEKAPHSLEEAINKATILVGAPDQPMTHAVIYEMRAVYRVGTEFDWKQHQANESARIKEITDSRPPDFKMVLTTKQP